MAESRTIQFSPTIGLQPKLFKVIPSSALMTTGGWALTVGYCWGFTSDVLLKFFGIHCNEVVPLSIFAAGALTDVLLRGKKAYIFDSQFWKGRRFAKAGVRHEVATLDALKPPKIKPQKMGKKFVAPIENEFDVLAFVDFDIGQVPVGAVLLQKGESLQLVFFWELETFASSISAKLALQIARRFRKSLRTLPIHETLTLYSGAWRDYGDRVEQLKDPAINRDKISRIINDWEASRIITQTALGRRLSKSLIATATYTTLSGRGEKANDGVEALYDIITSFLGDAMRVIAPSKKSNYKNVPEFLHNGYERGWRSLNRLLTKQMGITSRALSFDEVWTREYKRYNSGDVAKCPFIIKVTSRGMSIERFGDLHLKSVLFRRGAPQMEHKHHVYLPGRGQRGLYVGGAVWEEKPLLQYEESSEEDALAQLFFGSAVINDSKGPEMSGQSGTDIGTDIWDTEVVVQFTGVSQDDIRKRAGKLEDESNFSRKRAASKGEISTTANFKLTKTSGDRWALLEGGQVVKVGWMALVYRENPIELDRAVDALCDLPECKGYVVPERQYFPALWRQSLPIHHGYVGKGPVWWWDRRMEDFTEAAASFIPIMRDNTSCKTGLEYVSEYGNSPFYVEPYPDEEPAHTITLGESGSGKSVKVSGRMLLAYVRGIRSFVIDAAQGDISSFRPVCDAVGGGYFNSREDYFNFMQGTDFRRLERNDDKYKFAVQLLRDQWTQTIPDLALGGRKNPDTRADYRDIVSMLVNAWMIDPEIRRLYDIAYDGGFGSEAWQQMPTLRTFLDYAKYERLPTESQTDHNVRVIADFRSKLGAFLTRPSGELISKPSTFDTDKPVVVCSIGNINTMSEEDVLPLITSVLGLTTASALTYDKTAIEGDEASKLCGYDCFGVAFGGYFSGGRKQGITAHLIGQDLESLQKAADSSKFLSNTKVWNIGRVTTDAANHLANPDKGLGIPRDLLHLVDIESPMPDKKRQAYTRWLVKTEGKLLVGRYSPSFYQLAVSSNGKKVEALRQKYLAEHPRDSQGAYVAHARALKAGSLDGEIKIRR